MDICYAKLANNATKTMYELVRNEIRGAAWSSGNLLGCQPLDSGKVSIPTPGQAGNTFHPSLFSSSLAVNYQN